MNGIGSAVALRVIAALTAMIPFLAIGEECPEFRENASELVEISEAEEGVVDMVWTGQDVRSLGVVYGKSLRKESLRASLDGKDVTHLFSPESAVGMDDVRLPLPVGEHILRMTGHKKAGEQGRYRDCVEPPRQWQEVRILIRKPAVEVGAKGKRSLTAEEAKKIKERMKAGKSAFSEPPLLDE